MTTMNHLQTPEYKEQCSSCGKMKGIIEFYRKNKKCKVCFKESMKTSLNKQMEAGEFGRCKECKKGLGRRNKTGVCKKHSKSRLKHGMAHTSTYKIWTEIKVRCYNKKNPNYRKYGAKGVDMCDRWFDSFQNFLDDMGERPSNEYSIDRIDGLKGYSPENCRWADSTTQSRNRRVVRKYNGLTLGEWSLKLGLGLKTVYARVVKYGWSYEKATTTPRNNQKTT